MSLHFSYTFCKRINFLFNFRCRRRIEELMSGVVKAARVALELGAVGWGWRGGTCVRVCGVASGGWSGWSGGSGGVVAASKVDCHVIVKSCGVN
jgi:hypothetical protein